MKNGVDTKAFAERIKSATPDEQRRLWAAYFAWVAEGAKAGRRWILPAICLIAGSLMAAIALSALWSPTVVWIAAGAIMVAGLLLFRVGAAKERAWREQNPFRD
jgi:Flp pilus assembly protein TadB